MLCMRSYQHQNRKGGNRYCTSRRIGYICEHITCGDCGGTTKERDLEILEFTHFVEFFSFNKIGENHKEKILVQRVTVVVALDLGTGNTKNPEYESE